jgi:rare lipoprotein A
MKNLLSFLLLCLVSIAQASTPPTETGMATMYNDSYQGYQLSSKEKYDKNLKTAAHKTLPNGTMVRVTRVDDPSKSVVVRINDKGPLYKGYIIELSRRAAEEIGMQDIGSTMVKLEVLQEAPGATTKVEEPKAEAPETKTAEANKAETKPVEQPKTAEAKPAEQPKALPADVKARGLSPATSKKEEPSRPAVASTKKEEQPATKTPTAPAAKNVAAAPKQNEPKAAAKKEEPKKAAPAAKKPNLVEEAGQLEPGGLYKMQALRMELKGFGVQIAGYSDYEAVLQQLSTLQKNWVKGGMVYVDQLNGRNFYKVILGPFFTKEEAQSYCNSFKKKFDHKSAFVVNLEDLNKTATPLAPGAATPTPLAPTPASATPTPKAPQKANLATKAKNK